MQTTTLPSITRIDLDPRDLLVDVNIRTDARLDKDFVASIKDLGVLVPIIAVRTAAGDVRVRFGHRRTLAAIEADLATVPVEIVGDEATDDAGQIERIVTQHAENAHRAALSDSEQLGVVEQLNAFGMSAAQIGKRTKIKRTTVDNALTVAKSDLAKAACNRYDFLTLEQAAGVAEFDNYPDAVKELVVVAQQGGFDHVLQQLRDEREAQAAKQPIIDDLTATGVTIVDRPRWSDSTRSLSRLGDAAAPVTPEAHASCPGHVAWIDEEWVELPHDEISDDTIDDDDNWTLTYVAVYGCADPAANGHLPSPARSSARNSHEVFNEEARAGRVRVLRNNKAWRSAETVRREWLKAFVSRKSAPKGALRYVLASLAQGDYRLRDAMEKEYRFACELLGIDDTRALTGAMNDAGDTRAQMIALALVLTAYETDLGVHTWRSPNARSAAYLSQIAAWGYELSEIEQSVIESKANEDVGD
jgi:ParB family transcriptional regulator, chromosome partitioning protein